MPFRVNCLISIQRAGSALTGKRVSAAPTYNRTQINVREIEAHYNFAEAL